MSKTYYPPALFTQTHDSEKPLLFLFSFPSVHPYMSSFVPFLIPSIRLVPAIHTYFCPARRQLLPADHQMDRRRQDGERKRRHHHAGREQDGPCRQKVCAGGRVSQAGSVVPFPAHVEMFSFLEGVM